MIKKLFASCFIVAVMLSTALLSTSCGDALAAPPPGTGEEEEEVWTGGGPVKPARLHAVPGMKLLSLDWRASGGADFYEVWYGTGADIAQAQDFGQEITGTSVTLTGLADGTEYYVWVNAVNSEGKTASSALRCRQTADAVDPWWYTDVDFWSSGADDYQFRWKDGELQIGYCTAGKATGAGSDNGWATIRYHRVFPAAEMHAACSSTKTGHYTSKEDLTGYSGGVFIYERPNAPAHQRYYATYYWGFKSPQTANVVMTNPYHNGYYDIPRREPAPPVSVSLKNTEHVYLGNVWPIDGREAVDLDGTGPYSPTLEGSILAMTMGNFGCWIAFVSVPWYPVLDGVFKYGRS